MQGAQPKLFWNLLWHILYISDWIILNFQLLFLVESFLGHNL